MSAKKITDEQIRQCIEEGWTAVKIAKEFGINERTVRRRLAALKAAWYLNKAAEEASK